MKIQFLGDARDAFKWEYQDHLVKCLGYPVLQIVPMLTADDGSNDGKTHPTQFPADPVFHNFCLQLRQSRSLEDLYDLPSLTDADYRVALHRPDEPFTDGSRGSYFSGIASESDQVVFVDPDTGFEPKWGNETHVGYSDIEATLDQVTDDAVVSVYQHHRQGISWPDIVADIRGHYPADQCAVIYGYSVMFVTISKSPSVIESVAEANAGYAATRRLTAS